MSGHGRPPSKDPKTQKTFVRLSDNDMAKLEYCASQTGKTKAEIMRMGIDRVYQELANKKKNG